ncbi:MAG: PorT family protein [Bacteroidetes bacterium]|nr:PorT family protein [Bacteroidota bacterium]MBS1932482.1 PorT family protein [Bacteroidota bacterium]
MKRSLTVLTTRYSCISRFLVVSCSMLFFVAPSFSQSDAVNLFSPKFKPAKTSLGCTSCMCICFQGSLDIANIHETYAGAPGYAYAGYGSKIGFNFGVFATQPIVTLGPGQIAARAGLEFIQKGGKYGSGTDEENYRLNYIELPVDALYQYEISDQATVFAGFGPYFAYGVGGKIKYADGSPSDNAFGGDYGAKRFDFGMQVVGGIRLSCKATLNLAYDFGLISTSGNSYAANFKDKNGCFSINIGYCFGGMDR